MASVDSDVHHLREQSDLDRRRFAQRFNEDRKRLDEIGGALTANTVILARLTDSVERHERRVDSIDKTQSRILEIVTKAQGSVATLKWLIGGGILLELLRAFHLVGG